MRVDELVRLDELLCCDASIDSVDPCCLNCMGVLGSRWPANSRNRADWEMVGRTHVAHADNYQKQCDRNGWVQCPYCLKGLIP